MPKFETSGRWELGGRHIRVRELLQALAAVRNQDSLISVALPGEAKVMYLLDFAERAGEFTISIGDVNRKLPLPVAVMKTGYKEVRDV